MLRIFQSFFIYSVLGWILESVFHTVWEKKPVNRGFLNGPYVPIYGFGALAVIAVLQPLRAHWYVVFPVSILLTTILEYATGWAMEKIFKNRWWDYSSMPLNLHGRVCVLFSLGWGFLCLVLVYGIDPLVRRLIQLPPRWLGDFLSLLLLLFMLLDLTITVRAAIDLNSKLRQLQVLGAAWKKRSNELSAALLRHRGQLAVTLQKHGNGLAESIHKHGGSLIGTVQRHGGRLTESMQKRSGRLTAALQKNPNIPAVLTKVFVAWQRNARQLNYIQRRLIRAFPTMKSLRYPEAVVHLRSWLGRRRRYVLPARRIPNLRAILRAITNSRSVDPK